MFYQVGFMLTKSVVLLLILTFSQLSLGANTAGSQKALECKLPKGETLTIGCTNFCGRFNRWALRWYARKLGYRVKTVNLNAKNTSIDYKDVDGVIIPGGADIDPKYYIDKVTPEMKAHIEKYRDLAKLSSIGETRDKYEFDFLNKYFADKDARYQPVLGICRGMQAISVSQGLPLYLDIKTELGIKNRRYTLDRVSITNKDSVLQDIIKRSSFRGVELHHQGLNMSYYEKHRSNWPGLEVTAVSNDGKIAESIEFYNRPVMGVQFHPEYTFGRVRRGVFSWLLKQACFNKKNNTSIAINK